MAAAIRIEPEFSEGESTVKRRNRKGRRFSALGRKPLGLLSIGKQRQRRTWTIEKLEDRMVFSVSPFNLDVQTTSFGNDTAAGAAATLMREIEWQVAQSAAAANLPAPDYVLYSLPNDPLFPNQWHLLNVGQEVGNPDFQHIYGVAGQDINVVPVWNMVRPDGGIGYTGAGVMVAVIDSGVQTDHPDLAANISLTLRYDAIDGSANVDPEGLELVTDPTGAAHGTAVAGLIGAVWNNGEGGAGVAPGVTLVPIQLVTAGQTDEATVRALRYAMTHGVDITNNSWGPADVRQIATLDPTIYDALRDSVIFGRNGLGMINVWAAGNGGGPSVSAGFQSFGNWDSASYDPYINSRYVIGVTGVDHDGQYRNADGTFTSYPEAGADVLVAAPTGSNAAQNVAEDSGQGSGLWTTDLTGKYGFNAAPLPNGFDADRDFLPNPDYTSRFNGTSAAAPIVSGVIALMLEANPNLTYRDVQEILVRSSRTNAWYESPEAPTTISGGAVSGAATGSSAVGIATGSAAGSNTTYVYAGGGSLASGAAIEYDFGDAPAIYGSAQHRTDDNNLTLGPVRDSEGAGQPTPNADGDDNNPPTNPLIDDEDGVILPSSGGVATISRGRVVNVQVNAPQGGVLNAWIDFDQNNSWDQNTTEHVVWNRLLTPGSNLVTITVPAGVAVGQTYARFRLTSQSYIDSLINSGLDLGPVGIAPDGEVEDYRVIVQSGGGGGGTGGISGVSNFYTTWQTNQLGPFRDPDPYYHSATGAPVGYFPTSGAALFDPIANPAVVGNAPDARQSTSASPLSGNDAARRNGRYELMPALFANGAGYTVSQGYGFYGESVGYAHGIVDAELAVQLAKQWHALGQDIAPNTEKTYTTFVLEEGLNLPAAEKMANNGMLVPGGIGGQSGFIGYWDEYNADPPAPFDPANSDSWPDDSRGASYIDFAVTPNQQISVEYVEVKVSVSGPPSNLDFLRIMLTSPDGTQSELNHYYSDPSFIPHSSQVLSQPHFSIDPVGDIAGGTFVWTFSSNRNWGETTNTSLILNPITGEPVVGPGGLPIFRNWELHIENWGSAAMGLNAVEIVWHGKPVDAPSQVLTFDPAFPNSPGTYKDLQGGQNAWDERWLKDQSTNNSDPLKGWQIPMAQRIQGSVGIDNNGDNAFNFDRYLQEINGGRSGFGAYNASAPRTDDIIRRPDYVDVNGDGVFNAGTDIANQEEFASNVIVSLFRVNKASGAVDTTPTAYFLTGADGNFYFDVDPTYEWVIRISDPLQRDKLNDVNTSSQFMKNYQSEWRITPDWFFAPDRVNDFGTSPGSFYDPNPSNPGDEQQFKPAEILWGANDANGDGVFTNGPMPFTSMGAPIPMAVKNINFLLKATPPAQQFVVTGDVFADTNSTGVFDGTDALLQNVTVYVDANNNGVFENTETSTVTDASGHYSLQIPSTVAKTYSIGVVRPGADWQFKSPGNGINQVTLPSIQAVANFALTAPANAFPANLPPEALGRVLGAVFNDLNGDGTRQFNEPGAAGFRVFLDANKNGVYDAGEINNITASNGSFSLDQVPADGSAQIDVVIENEGTAAAVWRMSTPTQGYRVTALGPGGTATSIFFGVDNLADNDWGDLPDSYGTSAAANGPRHVLTPGFQLGGTIDGEANGFVSIDASGDGSSDDGVSVLSNSGVLVKGTNTLRVAVQGVGGLLTGWMDFNADGHFDESERLQWSLNASSLGGEADINPGVYDLQITIPNTAVDGPIAARFRWGEPGLSFVGAAAIGEVEDYFLGLNYIYGDYNRNGAVDQADFSIWLKQKGQSVAPYSGADGNGDGLVNQIDYDVWRAHFGNSLPAPAAGSSALLASNSLSGSVSAVGDQPAAVVGPAFSPAFAAAFFDDSSVVSTQPTTVVLATTTPLASGAADPLLLDLVYGDLNSVSAGSADGSLYEVAHHDEANANDLALAAVLSEDGDWWKAI